MKKTGEEIIGPDVGDQSKLRPRKPVHSLDEFFDFLGQLEALVGPVKRTPQSTTGDLFLL